MVGLANDPDVMAGNEAGQKKIISQSQELLKNGYITPENHADFVSSIPVNPGAVGPWINNRISQAMEIMNAVNFHYGQPGMVNTGAAQVPSLTSNIPGGIRGTGKSSLPGAPAIPTQAPPTQQEIGVGGPQYRGVQNPQLPPGTVQAPGGFPGQGVSASSGRTGLPVREPEMAPRAVPTQSFRQGVGPVTPLTSPAIKGKSNNLGGNVTSATVQDLPPAPRGGMAGYGPGQEQQFKQNLDQYAADQNTATAKATQLKPIQQVIKLLPGLQSGPGTEQFNNAVATLKAFNIIPTGANDPTAIRQEVNKKLSQYVQANGNRSDASQALKEESSPSAKIQIPQALAKLAKDQIALDRVEIARSHPAALEGKNITTEYGVHRQTFPQSQDEKAYNLDTLDPSERAQLIKTMVQKKNTPQGQRFWQSLNTAKRTGQYPAGWNQ